MMDTTQNPTPHFPHRSFRQLALACAMLAAATPAALAADQRTLTWQGNSLGDFGVATNWDPNGIPQYSVDFEDTVVFSDAGAMTVSFGSSYAVDTLSFLGTTGIVSPTLTLDLNGNSLTLNKNATWVLETTSDSGNRELVVDGGTLNLQSDFSLLDVNNSLTQTTLRITNGGVVNQSGGSANAISGSNLNRRAQIIVEDGGLLTLDRRLRMGPGGADALLSVTGVGSLVQSTGLIQFQGNVGGVQVANGGRVEATGVEYNPGRNQLFEVSGVGIDPNDGITEVASRAVINGGFIYTLSTAVGSLRVADGGVVEAHFIQVAELMRLEVDNGRIALSGAGNATVLDFQPATEVTFWLHQAGQDAGIIYTGSANNTRTISIGAGTILNLELAAGFSANIGDSFLLIDYSGAADPGSTVIGSFADDIIEIDGYTFQINYAMDGTGIGVSVIPEPGTTTALIALAALIVLACRNRSARRS